MGNVSVILNLLFVSLELEKVCLLDQKGFVWRESLGRLFGQRD